MYKVEIKPKAATQIKKAVKWYEEQQKNLGLQFLDQLESAFDSLSINPFYSIRYKDVRGFPLKKFPFLIMYKVNENVNIVSILAVFHTSKDPNKYPD